jgi:hypothetical protein
VPRCADGESAAFGARGGLHELFAMVLGGLVGATPHMVSAAVMALARLLYEFAPVLVGLVPDLLPAVLLLLRSKAREVIKSVLGFIKVFLGGGSNGAAACVLLCLLLCCLRPCPSPCGMLLHHAPRRDTAGGRAAQRAHIARMPCNIGQRPPPAAR